MNLERDSIQNLARCAIATAHIEEAHADETDTVRKVVIALPEWSKNPMVGREIARLWQEEGFIASINREGWLMIDGIKENWQDAPNDLIRAIQQGMRQLGQYLPDFSNDNLPCETVDAAEIVGEAWMTENNASAPESWA